MDRISETWLAIRKGGWRCPSCPRCPDCPGCPGGRRQGVRFGAGRFAVAVPAAKPRGDPGEPGEREPALAQARKIGDLRSSEPAKPACPASAQRETFAGPWGSKAMLARRQFAATKDSRNSRSRRLRPRPMSVRRRQEGRWSRSPNVSGRSIPPLARTRAGVVLRVYDVHRAPPAVLDPWPALEQAT